MIRILELFGGIGACSKALERLRIDYEIADYVEIDKYAVKSFNAIHNTNFEPQDIRDWNKDIEIDLIMHGSPCQDFSLAGKQAGGDKDSGTRSSLMYETIRIVKKLKPKYVIWENVKNLLSKKHIHNFNAYLETMEQLGYINYYQVLNAKDYGIPQNRERVFTISTRKDIDTGFVFPPKQPLKLKLKDMLEDEVDEKYYLSDVQVNRIIASTYTQNQRRIQEKNYCDTLCARDWKDPKCIQVAQMYGTEKEPNPQAGRIYDSEGILPTMDSCSGGNRMPKIMIKNNTEKGYLEAHEGDGVYTNVSTKRGTVQKDMIQTITTFQDKGVVVSVKNQQKTTNNMSGTLKSGMDHQQGNIIYNNLRIRKLTPKECWRLMGFDDEDYEKAAKVNSNTQLYKQAGNSIVVNVLEAILKNLLLENDNEEVSKGQLSIFDL